MSQVTIDHAGSIREDNTTLLVGTKRFKRMYNPTGGTLAANTIVMEMPDAATYAGNEIDAANTDNLNYMAGVVDVAIPTLSWGEVQIGGYRTLISVESTTDIVIGDSLKGVNGQTYAVKDQARGTESTYRRHITALAARTDNDAGTIAGIIRCDGR